MPRIAKSLVDGQIYHVLNRGNGRQTVFHKAQDYAVFRELMQHGEKGYPVRLLVYCLMPNYLHLVLWPAHGAMVSS